MPGVGDFNLRSFFRAMGIKNPETSMREFVQPVIVVGDMSEITPQYRPPQGYFGGDVAATVGEFSYFQMVSRAEGGSLVMAGSDSSLRFGTFATALAGTIFEADHILSVQGSVDPPVSLVSTGSVVPVPLVTNRTPGTDASFNIAKGGGEMIWIRPGTTFAVWSFTANASINRWWLKVIDLPASENSIL